MLNALRQKALYHLQAASQSFNYLCRKPLSALFTVIVIAVALALPSFMWVLVNNVSRFTDGWHQGGHISIYLKSPLSEARQEEILAKVRSLPQVGQAVLKTPAQGLEELMKQEGMHDVMGFLPENPLPAMIEVTPALTIGAPAKIDLLARELKVITGVDKVKMDLEWMAKLNAVLGFSARMAHVLMGLLALGVVFIIGNTLRLALHHRHEEVQILKLIGATDSFILRPFMYTGFWYGFLGGLFAVLLVNIIMLSLGMALNQLAVMYQMHVPLHGLSASQILILMAFSIILGLLGARFSVKRQLASIEPY